MATAAMTSWEIDLEDARIEPEETFESETEEYDPQAEADIRAFAATFHEDTRVLARQYLDQFFQDKMLYCGGRVPKWVLHNERRLSMVTNYDISRSVDRAYRALASTITLREMAEATRTGEATRDIKIVNETLKLLSRARIPKGFAGGMLLLYLEFVEGIDFGGET